MTLDEPAAATYLAKGGLTLSERDGILHSTHCDPPESYLVLSSALVSRRRSWMSLGLWDPRLPAANPPAIQFEPHWLPCRAARDGETMACEIRMAMGRGAPALHTFTYRVAVPHDARLHRRELRGGTLSDAATEVTPAAVLLADAGQMRPMAFVSPTYPELAVLVDVPGARIIVGALPFLRSTFVHLMYLDGRYAKHYLKRDDRTGLGERVVTWKIMWGGR